MKKETKLTIRLDSNLRTKYANHCKANGYSLSKRLRVLIDKDINNEIVIINSNEASK